MKETRFIAQNKEKWQESEKLLRETEKDPEKLSNLFTQVIDDLSYSRTYYPNRSVRVYLNKIAREYFSIIYSNQKSKKNAFRNFWVDELPQIVYASKMPLTISLIIFLMAVGIGVFSSMNDPQFTSTILGDRYVAMTRANIEKGDPMAVYKEAHQIEMFLGITLNNLMVAFRTYVFGIFLSIGTIAIMLYNGIMIGCFQYFFVEHGLLAESALTIWLHGTLEISSIILAGGAGLTLGSGLLFPGTYSRLQAFQITAVRSLKLMLGISPILVFAALIESFLTRYTEVPDALRLFLILCSGFSILAYFVYYPWLKSRKGFNNPVESAVLPPTDQSPLVTTIIKNNGEIMKDAFSFYKKVSSPLFLWVVLVTIVACTVEFMLHEPRTTEAGYVEPLMAILNNMYYAMSTNSITFVAINALASSLIVYRVFMLLRRETKGNHRDLIHAGTFLQIFFTLAAIYGSLYWLNEWGVVIVATTCGIFLLMSFVQFHERSLLWGSMVTTARLCAANFGQVMGLHFILLMTTCSFLLILSAPLLYLNITVLQWNFAETDLWSRNIVRFLEIFFKLVAFNLVIPIFAGSMAFLYFTLLEISSADNLKKSIAMVGHKNVKGIRV